MQRLFQHLAAEEITEDAHAAEEDSEPQEEEMEDTGKRQAIFADAMAAETLAHSHQPVHERKSDWSERQQVHPPAAPAHQRLLQFEAKHSAHLAHPEVHIVAPSPPIRYRS